MTASVFIRYKVAFLSSHFLLIFFYSNKKYIFLFIGFAQYKSEKRICAQISVEKR